MRGTSIRPSKTADVAPAWGGDGSAGSTGRVCQPEGEGKKGKGKQKEKKKENGKGQKGKINGQGKSRKAKRRGSERGRREAFSSLGIQQGSPWADTLEQAPLPTLGLLAVHFGIHSAGNTCAWLHNLAQL